MDFLKCSFTILGAGRSGIAAAKLLKSRGVKVFLSDENEKSKLKFFNEADLKKEGIEFELGAHSDMVFENDIIIKSPGISPQNNVIVKARQMGKRIYSEIEAASWFCKNPVIAITGTNGKTTTTVLTGEIFKNAGFDAKVCGNVGLAFSEVINELNEKSIVILEVSSFQLNDIEEFKPQVSVLLNVTPDHLDWHGSFENYLNAKLNITKNQTGDELAVINYDAAVLKDAAGRIKAGKAFFSVNVNLKETLIERGSYVEKGKIIYFDNNKKILEEVMNTNEINIRGNHNLYNSLAAIISARAFEIKAEIIKESLQKFPGVEHRIEFVREIDGVSFYNDSKATNIDSLIVALESFQGNLILILGGREKGNDYGRVDELVKQKVKKVIATGETREKIYDHFQKKVETYKSMSFEDAVRNAFESASKGDTILLSPACKSFDMFDSYEQRGKEFKRLVMEI